MLENETDLSFSSTLTKYVLALASIFFVYDLIADLGQGDDWSHFVLEACVFVLVSAALAWEIIRRSHLSKQLDDREHALSRMQGHLGERIRDQFTKWQLTDSETEVAWLIIKGYSFAEIAELRGVKEKTVRQQATAIYSKSGTSNRAEFSASFLEDLLTSNLHSPVPEPRQTVSELRRQTT